MTTLKTEYLLIEFNETTINDDLKPDLSFGEIATNYGYKDKPKYVFNTKEEAIERIKQIGGFSPKYIIVECYSVTSISSKPT